MLCTAALTVDVLPRSGFKLSYETITVFTRSKNQNLKDVKLEKVINSFHSQPQNDENLEEV